MIANRILTSVFLSASVFLMAACGPGGNRNASESDAEMNHQEEMASTVVNTTATLDPGQETAEVTSDGSGTLEATYDESTGELTYTLEWSDLTGAPTMMHFHGPAARGEDAGVKIPIEGFPAEASGSVSNTVTVPESDRADLLAGKWYVNIHTEQYGPGEIRGQVEFE